MDGVFQRFDALDEEAASGLIELSELDFSSFSSFFSSLTR